MAIDDKKRIKMLIELNEWFEKWEVESISGSSPGEPRKCISFHGTYDLLDLEIINTGGVDHMDIKRTLEKELKKGASNG